MAYQKKVKKVKFVHTGTALGKPGAQSLTVIAGLYKRYLAGLMTALQNAARQYTFRNGIKPGPCIQCGEMHTSWFYVDYGKPPQKVSLCQSHHKEMSQTRGSIYDQLVRHGLQVISWEDWKNGIRPETRSK